ncbi:MAG TPA: hypothetical protein V6C86_25500 [Oculatellaceae cyanobacterium]
MDPFLEIVSLAARNYAFLMHRMQPGVRGMSAVWQSDQEFYSPHSQRSFRRNFDWSNNTTNGAEQGRVRDTHDIKSVSYGYAPQHARETYTQPAAPGWEKPTSNNSGVDTCIDLSRNIYRSGNHNMQEVIVETARSGLGRELWQGSCGTEAGRLGCAASVSTVLKASGFEYADSPAVGDTRSRSGLVGQLLNHGWSVHQITEAQPGDVVFGRYQGGQHGHIGIIGDATTDSNFRQTLCVYDNNSLSRKWDCRALNEVFNATNFGNQLYVLRAPEVSMSSTGRK